MTILVKIGRGSEPEGEERKRGVFDARRGGSLDRGDDER